MEIVHRAIRPGLFEGLGTAVACGLGLIVVAWIVAAIFGTKDGETDEGIVNGAKVATAAGLVPIALAAYIGVQANLPQPDVAASIVPYATTSLIETRGGADYPTAAVFAKAGSPNATVTCALTYNANRTKVYFDTSSPCPVAKPAS